jgi:hypothetical protein
MVGPGPSSSNQPQTLREETIDSPERFDPLKDEGHQIISALQETLSRACREGSPSSNVQGPE